MTPKQHQREQETDHEQAHENMKHHTDPVLATCDIRLQMRPLRTPSHISRFLPIPWRKSRIARHIPAHLQQRNRMLCIIL